MAGDWNILQSLRILVGGWLHSVNLQEPRREAVSFHQTLYPTSPRRGNNLTKASKSPCSSNLGDKGMMPLFEPQRKPLATPALVLVPHETQSVSHPLFGAALTEQEAPQVLRRSPRE